MTKLKEMRLMQGIKVAELAARLHCTEMAIYNYENRKRGLKSDTLKKFAQIYGCKVDDLID